MLTRNGMIHEVVAILSPIAQTQDCKEKREGLFQRAGTCWIIDTV